MAMNISCKKKKIEKASNNNGEISLHTAAAA